MILTVVKKGIVYNSSEIGILSKTVGKFLALYKCSKMDKIIIHFSIAMVQLGGWFLITIALTKWIKATYNNLKKN